MNTLLYNKKAVFLTLGCKLNFAETSSLQDALHKAGAIDAVKGDPADICIVNTCSVTDTADQKCRQAIHRLHRENPHALIVVMGCYAQLQPEEIDSIEGVDMVVGQEQKGRVVELIAERLSAETPTHNALHTGGTTAKAYKEIQSFAPSCSRGNRTRYFLKVQDGCDYFCTYCTIPFARGKSRNGSIASLVAQAEEVAAQGGKEIVITGVNIGDFGRTTGETFFDLVKALDQVEGIERYRISSIEPNLLTDEIIDYCAKSRAFMPHFHIPLQSGSDDVLRLMHRKYDTALFRNKIEKIRTVMPDAFIGVDVIVGTRGETAEFFEDAYHFIESLDVQQLHVFSYSERPGTKALEIPHVVTPQERHERSQRLLALSEEKRQAFYEKYSNTTRKVLWEKVHKARNKQQASIQGWTDNYIRVEAPANPDIENTITSVTLGDFTADKECLKTR